MSTKGDGDRTSNYKKAGKNYTRIFGSEEEVRKRRPAYIEEQKRKKAEGDIKMVESEIPEPLHKGLEDEPSKT